MARKKQETAPPPPTRVSVVHLFGMQSEKDWVTAVHSKTHLSRSAIVRIALAEFGASRGLPPYPDRDAEA